VREIHDFLTLFWQMESLCCGMARQVTGLEHLMDTRVQSGQHVLILQHSMLLQLLQTSARMQALSLSYIFSLNSSARVPPFDAPVS
jgi:lauroyl/myristoyl acyltransferase